MSGLGSIPVTAVLRAESLQRAARFYTEVLGLRPVDSAAPGMQARFEAGNGTMLMIYERPGMPAPQNTTLGFAVPADRFDALIAELRSNGVTFEDYDIPEIGLRTQAGVATMGDMKSAWFTDTEGNIISLSTM